MSVLWFSYRIGKVSRDENVILNPKLKSSILNLDLMRPSQAHKAHLTQKGFRRLGFLGMSRGWGGPKSLATTNLAILGTLESLVFRA